MKNIIFTSFTTLEKSKDTEAKSCSAIHLKTGKTASCNKHDAYHENRVEVINELSQ